MVLSLRDVHVEFPCRFDGKEALQWIYKTELFFQYYELTDPYRLKIAAIHFDGPVVPWFQELQESGTPLSWSVLAQAIASTYGPPVYECPLVEAQAWGCIGSESKTAVENLPRPLDASQVFDKMPKQMINVAPIYTAGIKVVDDALAVFEDMPKRVAKVVAHSEIIIEDTKEHAQMFTKVLEFEDVLAVKCESVFASVSHEVHVLAPLENICLLGCSVTTGGAVWNRSKVETSSNVAVFGLGRIGLTVADRAKATYVYRIYGVSIDSKKIDIAQTMIPMYDWFDMLIESHWLIAVMDRRDAVYWNIINLGFSHVELHVRKATLHCDEFEYLEMGKETILINVDMIGHVGYSKSTTAQTNDIREVLELQKQLAWHQSQFDLLENQVSAMIQGRRCMIVASQSDLYFCRDKWKFYGYPLVLVHEIVGFVTKIGNGIQKFKMGDNMEVGCLERGCDTCEQCTNDSENYCDKAILIYNYIHHDGTRKQVVGNCTGGIKGAQEMLDLTTDYSINLDIEVISMSFVNTAMERLLQYQFVIDFSKTFQKWPLHLVEVQIVKELELVLKKQLIISIAFMAIAIAIVSWIALPSKFTIYNFGTLVFVVHIASNTGCARDNANKYIAAGVSRLASNQGPKGFVHMRLQYASVGNFSARLSSIHGMLLKDGYDGHVFVGST